MLLWSLLPLIVAFVTGSDVRIGDIIVDIENGTLMHISPLSIDNLDLSNLHLQAVDKNAFEDCKNLETLNLSMNSLEVLPGFALADLTTLKHLDLSGNALISGSFYHGLSSLEVLDISFNSLAFFESGHFSGLSESTTIVTEGLELSFIDAAMFESSTTVTTRAASEMSEVQEFGSTCLNEVGYPNPIDIASADPPHLDDGPGIKVCIQDGHLRSLEGFDKTATLAPDCQEIQLYSGTLLLTRRGIRTFAKKWYQLKYHKVNSLDLSNNEIDEVTEELLNDLPSEVIEVSLRDNKIEKLKKGVIENENPMASLDLGSNLIRDIEDGSLENLNLVDTLMLDYNYLSNTKFLESLPSNVLTISLHHNMIVELSSVDFSKFSRLSSLDLSSNGIVEVKVEHLTGLSSLKTLNLRSNNVREVEAGCFQNMKNLSMVDISFNRITSLEGVFSGLTNICAINSRKNNLTSITNTVFSEMKLLQELDLSINFLSEVDGGVFLGLEKLDRLSLAENHIETIAKGTAKYLSHLSVLDLSYNRIRKLQNGCLYGLPKSNGTRIHLTEVPIDIIEAGLFDDI